MERNSKTSKFQIGDKVAVRRVSGEGRNSATVYRFGMVEYIGWNFDRAEFHYGIVLENGLANGCYLAAWEFEVARDDR